MSSTRQLAAIMFTDIVGYTALMGKDSAKALELVRISKDIQKPLVEKHNGKWLKEMGDGAMAQFSTALDAVNCSIDIQKSARAELDAKLRIGIHLGDIIVENNDVYGDGVNVASRLESIADPGGIYISDGILKAIQGQSDVKTKYLGEISLKNVAYDVRIHAIQGMRLPVPESQEQTSSKLSTSKKPPKKFSRWIILSGLLVIIFLVYYMYPRIIGEMNNGLSEEPDQADSEIPDRSLAVLPFENMSNDPDQDYFSDGMTEEILNQLVQIEGLKIPSRTTLMRYKGSGKSGPEIGKELGVAHILEGSVRKQGNKVRITAQLIDVSSDNHLWSKNYDRSLDDIFTIQTEVAQQIASALKAEISPEVKQRMELKLTQNTEALDLYMRAKSLAWPDPQKAEELLHQAISIDSNFVPAYAELGIVWINKGIFSGFLNAEEVVANAAPFLSKALSLNYEYPATHTYLGMLKLLFEWDFEAAMKEINIAYQLNPSDIDARPANILLMQGLFEEALSRSKIGFSVDPSSYVINLGLSQFFMNQREEALKYCEKALEIHPDGVFGTGRLSLYLHLYDEVIKVSELWLNNNQPSRIPVALGNLAISYYHTGQIDKIGPLLEELKQKSEHSPVGSPAYFLAMTYTQMGEKKLAYEWLEKAYLAHEMEMIWLKVEPPFEPLHDDSRWQEMLDKVGFPD